MIRKMTWLRGVSTVLLLFIGFIFEEAMGSRMTWILGLSLGLVTLVLMESTLKVKVLLRGGLIFAQVLILMVIEYHSKYAINYFYHILYLFFILYQITYFKPIWGIGSSLVITFLSFIKLIQLNLIQPTFANMAMLLFFSVFQLLIVLTLGFVKIYFEKEKKTQQLYKDLLIAHGQLEENAQEIKALTISKERNQLARDLHDTLGHELMGVIMQMEMAQSCLEDGQTIDSLKLIEAAKQAGRDSLVKVREIVTTLKDQPDHLEEHLLEDMVDRFYERTGCEVLVQGLKELDCLSISQYEGIYRLIQEALTNAVRHGHASRVTIRFYKIASSLDFHIHDNGVSCDQLEAHQGLKGMHERIQALGGQLTIQTKPVFTIEGRLTCEE